MKIELKCTRQVRMSRARRRETPLRIFRALSVFDRKRFLPRFPVAIFDADSDGGPYCFPMPNARQEIGLILFDFLPSASPVTELPAMQLPIHKLGVNGYASRKSGDPADERLSVRFACREKSQHVRFGGSFEKGRFYRTPRSKASNDGKIQGVAS